ncbi:BOP1NT-domain-containing protein [Gonapodya prolifera JEL478]|uniref:Ribosome biogenesis protein ERB1 n=1 Tax=Gonapodya prolifera (strain JEL478) TaxID=1344416 RepID=A0A139AY97_GONPJ|nr:BOP1NT-domain-containing protein [Gonapodya prolifera JEL478]|eukprot:KXS21716.1 BOP1NT-domain-containing protein [Gonapodya prolifera JEL478]
MPKRKSTDSAPQETGRRGSQSRPAPHDDEEEENLLAIDLHEDSDDSDAGAVSDDSDDADEEDSGDDDGVDSSGNEDGDDARGEVLVEDTRGSAAKSVLAAWGAPAPAKTTTPAEKQPSSKGKADKKKPGVGAVVSAGGRGRSNSEDSGYTSKSSTTAQPRLKPSAEDGDDSDGEGFEAAIEQREGSGSDLPWWRQHPEIEPVYDSDTTDDETTNTVGNIPLSWYDEYDHVGYDKDGKKIARGAKKDALDELLSRIDDDPNAWRTIYDALESRQVTLTPADLALIRRAMNGKFGDTAIDPYEPTVEWFTSKVETAPISAAPEPKRRWAPSKHEAKRIMKIVRAIRQGRKPPPPQVRGEENYAIWDASQTSTDPSTHPMHIPAPLLPPPTDHESYNPPPELVPTPDEVRAWQDADEEERERNFLTTRYGKMRDVPGWEGFLRERFERCLDLYLCPRVRKNKINMNPEDLLPTLPDPSTLRPFPTHIGLALETHPSLIRNASMSPTGTYLATACDDGAMRVYEVATGRMWGEWRLGGSGKSVTPVRVAAWNPNPDLDLVAVGVGGRVVVVETGTGGRKAVEETARVVETDAEDKGKKGIAEWKRIPKSGKDYAEGQRVVVDVGGTVTSVVWHRRGDYFASVGGDTTNPTLLIHQLSRRASQSPLSKSKGAIQQVAFHPNKPMLYVALQRSIRVYDLASQTLSRKLLSTSRWLSSLSIHPSGDHVLAGGYDRRVCWWDGEMGETPWKTLRSHSLAVRSVSFHPTLPLLATASDDCTVQIFHATVYTDLMRNPLLVPVRTLKGFHETKGGLGVLGVCWHPREAWCLTWGADGKAAVWTH